MVDQFNSEMNPLAHYNTTAPEIWAQTDHEVTAVVCTLGTTGTVMGIGRRMKELNPDIKIIAIEPNQNHKIQGLKNMTESYVPGIFDRSLPDRIINVSDEECFSMLKRLTVEEGLFVGMSSGAAAAGALKYIDEIDEGVVVVIFPDGGERYLSTHIYNNCREVQHTPDAGAEKQAAKKLEDIYLFNTMTRQKEKMLPLEEGKIKLYTCGPTVDRLIDLHQMRRYVITDILIRYLEYKNYSVTHVVNVTDIDDRTILASQNSNTPLADLTSQYMDEFLSDMDSLKITRASTYCRYSDNIEDMIALTKKLYAKGLAYEKHRSIYFDVSRYRKYGVFLNGLDHEQKAKLENDAESHESDHAEDPMDFTLFKRATLNELKKGLHFKSEWGSGRPSWHVACAALAMKYLGDQYDIHTSASMHMYPHNENTIATACALGKKNLANYWLHTAPVAVDHATMSWKNGNVTTVRELLERKYPVRHLRCFFLNANYREHLNYSEEILKHTSGKMERLDAFLQKVLDYTPGEQGKDNHFIVKKWVETFEASLNNDLDVVSALQSVFDLADEATPLIENGWLSIKDHDALFSALRRMDSVLMVMNLPSEK
jgi:cysteinyl-tRNA synthetase